MKSQIEKAVFETIRKFNQSNKDGFTLKPDKKTTIHRLTHCNIKE